MHSNHHYGWYPNRARGERKKRGLLRPGDEPEQVPSEGVAVLDASYYDPPRLASKTWRQLIYKVWKRARSSALAVALVVAALACILRQD